MFAQPIPGAIDRNVKMWYTERMNTEQPWVEVVFAERAKREVLEHEQGASLCAAGYVYTGSLRLHAGARSVQLPVQTGGWMNADSPFARAGLCPPASAKWGEYAPQLLPDTAFPALAEPTMLSTERTGKRRGFRVPDPPGTGRSALMVHVAERYGSEGCISTPDLEGWEAFCSAMAELRSAGHDAVPIRVVYTSPLPEPSRFTASFLPPIAPKA